ncbi:MAG: phospholipase [Alphaproteobacteria bacterium]|nr:phospholipase [Alphaproteobacteria bacterium]
MVVAQNQADSGSTLGYLDQYPAGGQKPKAVIFLLHGYGAAAEDLMSLADVWQPLMPNTLFVAPNAPFVCDHLPSGRQWFPLYEVPMGVMVDGLKLAAASLNQFVQSFLAEQQLQHLPVALVGFSQGAMTALYAALKAEGGVRAVLSYSGLLLDVEDHAKELKDPPAVFLIHGQEDPVIPAEAMGNAEKLLQNHKVPVKSLMLEGLGHGIDERALAAGAAFLVDSLA